MLGFVGKPIRPGAGEPRVGAVGKPSRGDGGAGAPGRAEGGASEPCGFNPSRGEGGAGAPGRAGAGLSGPREFKLSRGDGGSGAPGRAEGGPSEPREFKAVSGVVGCCSSLELTFVSVWGAIIPLLVVGLTMGSRALTATGSSVYPGEIVSIPQW
jgi:hypothetical protein